MDRKERTMRPRILARQDCSGGTCPAVYDDIDALPGQLVIQGTQADAALLGTLTGRADYENAVIIPRRIVAEALHPADEPVDLAGLMRQFETFRYSAFRLEIYQNPVSTGRDEQWITMLKAGHRWGKTYRRVRIADEPLTPAVQQELTEGYAGNVSAHEDIRIIPVAAPEEWPDDVPPDDFWLFDASKLYLMHYAPDGTWTGASKVTDPGRIVRACIAATAALHHAVPWHTYIASRPDLKRRLAQ
jgi:hypothetical protein